MVLMNYVELKPETPTRMHFTDAYYMQRQVPDRDRGGLKWVNSLVFWVDELNGEKVAKTFSVLSDKLKRTLEPYVPEKSYEPYDFVITKSGAGFATDFSVEAIPRG